jgi:hypothetical protein
MMDRGDRSQKLTIAAFPLPLIVIIGTLCGMETYYADESNLGHVRSGEYPFPIGVLLASDDSRPSGIAFEIGSTVDGLALWRLKVHGEHVPGRFIIEDGQFVEVPARIRFAGLRPIAKSSN